jgi:hypothetical protein
MLAIAATKVDGSKSAEKYYRKLLDLEEKKGGKSVWSLGNRVNAALGLQNAEEAKLLLNKLRDEPEANQNKESIARYFDEIVDAQHGFDFNWRQHWP